MKKTFLAILSLLLVAVVALSMAACGEKEPQLEKKKPVSQFTAKGEWPELNDPLSWEDINSHPIKTTDMTIEEARQLCVDFFRYAKTAAWIPDDNFDYWHMKKDHEANNPPTLTQNAGQIYAGVPYIYVASGNIYRLMDFMDPATGVVDMSEVSINPHLYGNQCSIGSYWGWARVINSPDYDWTQNIVENKGFPRVGPYTYDPYTTAWSDAFRTTAVLQENGEQTMFESYAQLKAGDGIVYYTSAGHVVMISADAVVVRDENGKINGAQSYVKVIDQTPGWAEGKNEAGDTYQYEKNVDAKWDFLTMFKGNYVPFTYKEWLGEDPIEITEVTVSFAEHTVVKGEIEEANRTFKSADTAPATLSKTELFKTEIVCNYGLSDIYCTVYDAIGNEVYKTVTRAGQAGIKELKFSKTAGNSYTWGNLEELPADGTYTAKIEVMIGTGERPVLWEGAFTLN